MTTLNELMVQTYTLTIGDTDDNPEVIDTTLLEFIEANEETLTPHEILQATHLKVGESLMFGGGAAPISTFTRTS